MTTFDPRVLRRNTDPETSYIAAEQAESLTSKHYKLIIASLKKQPGTIYEIGVAIGLSNVQVARRMPELYARNVVKVIGTKNAPTNRPCRIWAIREQETDT